MIPSFQARALRVFLRATTRLPLTRSVGSPRVVSTPRATLDRGALIFGRLPAGATRVSVDEGPIRGEWVLPQRLAANAPTIFYLHGGGYVACSPATHRTLTGALALRCGARVFVLDYRLAPEHPFPAALHDAMAGFAWLRSHGIAPEDVTFAGDSAGGGLALATALALRDAGKPLPGRLVLFSPWVDLAGTGDSIRSNAMTDDVVVNDGSNTLAHAYLAGRALDDPAASPLYASLHDLPPMLIHASEIEMLRDDAVRLTEKARAAGVDVRLRLWDGVLHCWQLLASLPESRASVDEVAAFVNERRSKGAHGASA